MNAIKLSVHGTGAGRCLLSGRDQCDGLTVTFEDGTVREAHLSWKAFRQLLALKTGQNGKPLAPAQSTAAGSPAAAKA